MVNNLLNVHINSKKFFTITGYSIPDNYLNKKLIKKIFIYVKDKLMGLGNLEKKMGNIK